MRRWLAAARRLAAACRLARDLRAGRRPTAADWEDLDARIGAALERLFGDDGSA